MNRRAVETGVLQGSVAQPLAVLTFRTNEQVYGLPVTAVSQLIEMVAITPVPEAPPTIQGVINVHGEIVPVMDLRLRLGLPFKPYHLRTPIILMQANGRSLALVVDEVKTVIDIDLAEMQSDETVFDFTASESQHQTNTFSSIAKVNTQLIIIINANSLVSNHLDTQLTQVLAAGTGKAKTKAHMQNELAGV